MAVMANLSFIERQRFNLVEGKVKENGQMFTLAVHRVEWFSAGVSSSQDRDVGIDKPIGKPPESSRGFLDFRRLRFWALGRTTAKLL